jgi:hypothetical protein
MRVSLGKRGLLLVATAAVAVAAGAGVAYATGAITTGSPQTIVGCAKNENGQLRIVGDAAQCLSSEHAVSFAAPAAPAGPVAITVDCGAGGNLQQAIDSSDATQPLTVTIQGTCTASVSVSRDDVTLQAGSSGGGVTSDGNGPALQTIGARNISLQGLTLTDADGNGALFAGSGALVQANDDHIVGDVSAADQADVSLGNDTIDHCQNVGALFGSSIVISGGSLTGCGVKAAVGSSAFLVGGVSITHTRSGVAAENGGSIAIDSATIANDGNWGVIADGGSVEVNGETTIVSGNRWGVMAVNGGTASVTNGARVSDNEEGVAAGPGGHLSITSDGGPPAIVENNTGAGVRLIGASSLSIGGQAIVRGNGGDGISVSDTSVAVFNDASVTGNTGWGVQCDGSPSVAVIRGPTDGVTGNTAGNVDCVNAGQPG